MKLSTKQISVAAVVTALTCVIAPISFPVGTIPITLSVFCVFLCGAVLPPYLCSLSMIVYLAIGSIGVPVFSGFRGGFQILAGPTGGFLIAYPFMAVIISLVVGKFGKKIISLASGMAIALIVCYGLGTLWFVVSMGADIKTALSACVVPFIPFDIAKLVLATVFAFALEKALKKANIQI